MRQVKSFKRCQPGEVLKVPEITFGKYKIFKIQVSTKERFSGLG